MVLIYMKYCYVQIPRNHKINYIKYLYIKNIVYIWVNIIRLTMRNYILKFLSVGLFAVTAVTALSQEAPRCRNLNLPVGSDDSSTIQIAELVANAALAAPVDVMVMSPYGTTIRALTGMSADSSFRVAVCPYVRSHLTIMVANGRGACESVITFKSSVAPLIAGRSETVYCTDSLVDGGHIDGVLPVAHAPCEPGIPVQIVADWIEQYPCEPGQDTAKVIYRTYEAVSKTGVRGTNADTIVVLRLPEISRETVFCGAQDTIYCEDPIGNFGPFMLLPNGAGCDTLYFLHADGTAKQFGHSCGLSVHANSEPFTGDCGPITRWTVQIKQTCAGADATTCASQDDIDNGNELTPDGTYWSCVFWQMEFDTIGPTITCPDTLITVAAGAHQCAAEIQLPDLIVRDRCHDVKLVKALLPSQVGILYQRSGDRWVAGQSLTLPLQAEPIPVILEAVDECHNVSYDTCHIAVKDATAPVALAEKRVNVSMSQKKVWVGWESFDEGSWDNCDVALHLVRRTDWKEACVHLCDSLIVEEILPSGDTIFGVYLDEDDEVEGHYQRAMQWFGMDGQVCGDLLADAYRYALTKYATVQCRASLSDRDFDRLYAEGHYPPGLLPELAQLGGGWSEAVPVCCADVCQLVTVELLVMDYWCNWSRSWSDLWVEDKSPIEIGRELTPAIEISCKSFKEQRQDLQGESVSLADIVQEAQAGNDDAYAVLDDVFGGYQKAWRGPHGDLVDSDGRSLPDILVYPDSLCLCVDTAPRTPDPSRYCFYQSDADTIRQGAWVVNCGRNVRCEQEIWPDLDACGQGSILRKWKIWKECPTPQAAHPQDPDTLVQTQLIWVGNACPLDSGMFVFPPDTLVETCVLTFDANGSGNVAGAADPDLTGRPTFTFDDDCRQVGIGYFDKVLDVLNDPDVCYKILRTWCFADWCTAEKSSTDDWIGNPTFEGTVFKYVQKILVSCDCQCILNCENLRDTSIACNDIPTDVSELFDLFGVPTIDQQDPTMPCPYTLNDTTVIDTNACGIGTLTRRWYLLDEAQERLDSCEEVISLIPDPLEFDRRRSYRGDAEPRNCEAFIRMDPVLISDVCDKLGPFTITNDSQFATDGGADATGTYLVGVHYVNYTITSPCLAPFILTDTVTVIDDVDPTVTARSDPCVTFMEWDTIFNNDPTDPAIREQLVVMGGDNCALDTVLLVHLDSFFFPDSQVRDSILYTYIWQARDTMGNLTPEAPIDLRARSSILVSDACGQGPQSSPSAITATSALSTPLGSQQRGSMKNGSGIIGSQRYGGKSSDDGYELYQNWPNPFSTSTQIGFTLAQGAEVVLTVLDVQGRVLKAIQGPYARGYHEVELEGSELPASGVLYYRLKADTFVATRKMILMD